VITRSIYSLDEVFMLKDGSHNLHKNLIAISNAIIPYILYNFAFCVFLCL